jgi:hypothetical protein
LKISHIIISGQFSGHSNERKWKPCVNWLKMTSFVKRIFVIPVHCHLLDSDSYAPCNDVIFSQLTQGFHFLSFECPENWLEIIIWLIFKRRFVKNLMRIQQVAVHGNYENPSNDAKGEDE